MSKKISTNHPIINKTEESASEEDILKECFHEAWILTCKAFNIDPENPPKMDKCLFFAGSFEDHQKCVDEQEEILKAANLNK